MTIHVSFFHTMLMPSGCRFAYAWIELDIREHAILCIRSLLQGNPANQKIVEGLNARGTVPSEVLDKHGYEPVIDEKGRVRLQRVGEKPKT